MAGKPRSVALALIDSTPVRWCSDIAAPACSNKRSPECWTAAAPSAQIKAGAARAAATVGRRRGGGASSARTRAGTSALRTPTELRTPRALSDRPRVRWCMSRAVRARVRAARVRSASAQAASSSAHRSTAWATVRAVGPRQRIDRGGELCVRIRKSCERAWQVAGVAGSRADAGDCPGGQPGCWGGVAQAWRSSGLAVQGRNRSSAGPVGGFPPLRPHRSR